MIIHTRDADDDTIAILDEEYKKGRSAAKFTAFRLQKTGRFCPVHWILHFSIGNHYFQQIRRTARYFAEVPLDRLLVETDAPFLAPVPMRGRRNESSFVVHTAEKLAQIKDVPLEKLAQITSDNFYRLFRKASDKGRYAY